MSLRKKTMREKRREEWVFRYFCSTYVDEQKDVLYVQKSECELRISFEKTMQMTATDWFALTTVACYRVLFTPLSLSRSGRHCNSQHKTTTFTLLTDCFGGGGFSLALYTDCVTHLLAHTNYMDFIMLWHCFIYLAALENYLWFLK